MNLSMWKLQESTKVDKTVVTESYVATTKTLDILNSPCSSNGENTKSDTTSVTQPYVISRCMEIDVQQSQEASRKIDNIW